MNAIGREAGLLQLRSQRHGKAAGVRGAQHLLGIASFAIAHPRAEIIIGIEGAASHGDMPAPALKVALPFGFSRPDRHRTLLHGTRPVRRKLAQRAQRRYGEERRERRAVARFAAKKSAALCATNRRTNEK